MEKLPKDILIEIALNLNPNDVISFCKSGKRENQVICQNEHFWRQKLVKDYPEYVNFELTQINYKTNYLNMFIFHQEIHRFARDFLNRFFGESQRYMNKYLYLKDFKVEILKLFFLLYKLEYDEFYDGFYRAMKKFPTSLKPRIITDILNQQDMVADRLLGTDDDPNQIVLEILENVIQTYKEF